MSNHIHTEINDLLIDARADLAIARGELLAIEESILADENDPRVLDRLERKFQRANESCRQIRDEIRNLRAELIAAE